MNSEGKFTRHPNAEIVVADGSELMRRSMLRLLQRSYDVRAVSDGGEALDCLARFPQAILLTGLKMKPMDGTELLDCVAQRWPDRIRQSIVMTGWPDPHRWVPPGVLVLHKPVSPEMIIATVESRAAHGLTGPRSMCVSSIDERPH